MPYLNPSYDLWIVAASVLIAGFASYVTLDLTKRVRSHERSAARAWWIGGSLAMGSGIWSMHFVGMLAYSLPTLALGYTAGLTLLSWVAAVAVSALALHIAAGGTLGPARLAGGALAMGAGICAMHYIGMAAIELQPGIVWNWTWVALSALIAVGASAAALLIFFWLRRVDARRAIPCQAVAALVMGLAISGMHYAGMAAANVPGGSLCLSADQLGGAQLGQFVMLATFALLGMTLLTSILDARLQTRTALLAASLQNANQELQRRAFLDPLTELPNRLLLEDRLEHALARAGRVEENFPSRSERGSEGKGRRVALLFVDLDGFKPVNDSLGHAAGDLVLKEVARRLLALVRDSDTVARLGGDEFVLLLEDVVDVAACAALAHRLVLALAQPILIDDKPQHVSASVGIAVYPEHGPAERLMGNADAAMYAAKRTGGNTYVVFQSHMDAGAGEQLSLQNDLRQALQLGQLALHYQPKFDSRRGQLRGVEALLRWQHPRLGEVAPAVFIPVAERFGLINALGGWVIEEACRQMRAWFDQGLRMRVAINLSVHQLRQPDLAQRVESALNRNRIDASMLLCEITESVAMEDIGATQRAFDELSRIGVYLSIDDFGTGYSSLAYLRQLPARQLKIDRSFIQDLESNQDARAVVDAVIKLAHALDLSVVAEGVETAGQRDILQALDCDELQGFLFAKAMPAQQLQAWADGQKPAGVPADAPEFSASMFIDGPPP
ncbi:EAL domain-containing protein [Roseateles sp. DAIF2]|uniref:putative bifunctional diguanylate cyclase/phosphodiesterase n=1 Tax=Roseateles sp. DAIF2 TaxID=2714952 RepID=UPI0018A2598E|nr:bifunctional diguanylate cyclase/phosphodiesterase [Roseateles sp. DAIF2]QPF73082.1 EAL domain-containing protein [Roseateles sp. DAIF2]